MPHIVGDVMLRNDKGVLSHWTLRQTPDMHHLISAATPQVPMGKQPQSIPCTAPNPQLVSECQGLRPQRASIFLMMQVPHPPCRSHCPSNLSDPRRLPVSEEGIGSPERWRLGREC